MQRPQPQQADIRSNTKPVAPASKQDAQAKNAKPKIELTKTKVAPATVSAPQAPGVPVQPVLRMPAPEGPPMARKL